MKLPEKFGDALTVAMDLQGNIFEPAAMMAPFILKEKI